MAFWALRNRVLVYRACGYINMISEYKKYLKQRWMDSLSDEERDKYYRMERERIHNTEFALLFMSICANLYTNNS